MADIEIQSTDRLPGNTSPDTPRVLYRGRIRCSTGDYTLSGSWYRATKTVDLGQFDITNIFPNVEYYWTDGTMKKGGAPILSNAGAITANVALEITAGTKSGNESTKLNFYVGNNAGGQIDIYYQILSTPSSGSLFP